MRAATTIGAPDATQTRRTMEALATPRTVVATEAIHRMGAIDATRTMFAFGAITAIEIQMRIGVFFVFTLSHLQQSFFIHNLSFHCFDDLQQRAFTGKRAPQSPIALAWFVYV